MVRLVRGGHPEPLDSTVGVDLGPQKTRKLQPRLSRARENGFLRSLRPSQLAAATSWGIERWWPKGTKEGERGGEWFAPSFLRLMTRIRASGLVSGEESSIWSPPASPVPGGVDHEGAALTPVERNSVEAVCVFRPSFASPVRGGGRPASWPWEWGASWRQPWTQPSPFLSLPPSWP